MGRVEGFLVLVFVAVVFTVVVVVVVDTTDILVRSKLFGVSFAISYGATLGWKHPLPTVDEWGRNCKIVKLNTCNVKHTIRI